MPFAFFSPLFCLTLWKFLLGLCKKVKNGVLKYTDGILKYTDGTESFQKRKFLGTMYFSTSSSKNRSLPFCFEQFKWMVPESDIFDVRKFKEK